MSIALEGGVHDARREAAQGAPPVQGRGRVAVRAKAVEALAEHHEAGAAGCGPGVWRDRGQVHLVHGEVGAAPDMINWLAVERNRDGHADRR